jgi:DNA mismatch endonuclease (patch repair protein)
LHEGRDARDCLRTELAPELSRIQSASNYVRLRQVIGWASVTTVRLPSRSTSANGSWASSPETRRSMRSNRRTDTLPERTLRSALHRQGLRFRKDYRVELDDLRVRVDVVFPRRKLAVFIDGCFWHRCPQHRTDPRSNGDFWERKLSRNVERDREVDVALMKAGWTVVRCWEHEPTNAAAERVRNALETLSAT